MTYPEYLVFVTWFQRLPLQCSRIFERHLTRAIGEIVFALRDDATRWRVVRRMGDVMAEIEEIKRKAER